MKINQHFSFLLFAIIFFSNNSFAASVTVQPFELKFELDTSKYDLDFELKLACRYEKFVIGDSAEYNYEYKNVNLGISKIKKNNGSNVEEITLSNKRTIKLVLDGMFKYGKECQTYFELFLVDKNYSIGWANQFHRPIKLGIFDHSRLEEYKVFDFNKFDREIGDKELSFNYNSIPGAQVNVNFTVDGSNYHRMSFYTQQSVAINRETNMPYPLKKN